MNQTIYLFVEGDDDYRFFDRKIKPELEKKYKYVKIITYASEKRPCLEKTIKGIRNRDSYIFVADMDSYECYTKKKEYLRLNRAKVEPDKIIIVKHEIESWYVAGLKQDDAKSLNVIYRTNTEQVTKEMLRSVWLGKFRTKKAFLLAVLKRFTLETAKENNPSFKYFYNRYLRF